MQPLNREEIIAAFDDKDALLVFSVGGGSQKASYNLVLAMETAKEVGARIVSIVSRDGGAAQPGQGSGAARPPLRPTSPSLSAMIRQGSFRMIL